MDLSLSGCGNLGQAFERVVELRPGHTALAYPTGERISYAELSERVDRIAAGLLERGVKARQVVALFNHKSVDGIAAILACNKLGVLYANIDPASPPERCVRILDRCMPTLILVDELALDNARSITGAHANKLVRLQEVASQAGDTAGASDITGSDGAYIMFTSGSTGFPKGAVITHQNVLNFIAWGRHSIGITPDDVMTNVNPIYFDNSVYDLYVALYNGATLCPFTTEQVKDDVRKEVLQDCYEMAVANGYLSNGGAAYAEEMLAKALGSEKASEIMGRLMTSVRPRHFEKMRREFGLKPQRTGDD